MAERNTMIIAHATGAFPRASHREWIGLGVLALACLLYSLDATVLYLAVPQISAALKPSSSQLLWMVDIYGFLLAGSLIPMGRLGDRIGRRRLLLLGAAAFGLCSIAAAFATSAQMLIAARALQGIAAATLAPSTLSLIRNMFLDPKQRTVAIGLWAASFSAGAAIGPLVGGALLSHFWWGSVFLVAVPVMLLLVLGPRLLPEYQDRGMGRLDLLSAALSLFAVLAVIYGIKQLAQDGTGWGPLLAILAGLALFAVFIVRQHQLTQPLLDLRLFRMRAFSAALTINTLGLFVTFAGFLFIAQYLQLVLGMGPMDAGLWMLPSSIGLVVGSLLTPLFVRWVRPAYAMAAGLGVLAVGFGVLTQLGGASALWIVVAGSVLLALGIAPVGTLATDLIIGTVPPERAGVASGLSETSSELGGALGIALLGSLATAVYRHELSGTIPHEVPHQVARVARDTLGGALSVASQLPHAPGQALIASARAAWASATILMFSLCRGLALLAALAAVMLLRERTGAISPDQQPELVSQNEVKEIAG
jgi:MFS transporter, DHA2 family, multidrug resistance protein